MDLSVIIVNYNVRQFLENALVSMMRALDGLHGEIFVVDNASDDGSVEMLKTKFPDVRLIANDTNLGFARANNLALQQARGKYLLLINPDTIVQEDTFRVMIDFFERNPDVGLAGCKILNPDGTLQLPCRRSFPTPWVAFTKTFGLSALFPNSRLFGRYNLTYLNPDESYEVEAVSGSFMMATREAYERVGGLDETFFMYGEDLDWCYRLSRAGLKVFYVHSTKIIHFKGESTRRSSLDEIKVFYRAMEIFVEKHFGASFFIKSFLKLGIVLRTLVAVVGKLGRAMISVAADTLIVDAALIMSELLYFGHLFRFPAYAYPIVWSIPALIVTATLWMLGLYGAKRYSVSRALAGVLLSFTVVSAIVFFAKDFAFSRAVVLISAVLSVVAIPGWRLLFVLSGRSRGASRGRKSLFGRRTIIVGTGSSAQELLRRLRARIDDGFDVVGFVDISRRTVGEKIGGLEVIGSIDNVGKIITERRVGEVIFSTEGLSYTDILSVIGRSNNLNVNFRLVPNSLEAIIGKTRIDDLDTIPLVEIEYNIHSASNRFFKRMFDICLSLLLLITAYPLAWIRSKAVKGEASPRVKSLMNIPHVLSGRCSFVGRPMLVKNSQGSEEEPEWKKNDNDKNSYLGPCGLTGLVQINHRDDMTKEEIERYQLYYAKNQSIFLDIEILLKSLLGKR